MLTKDNFSLTFFFMLSNSKKYEKLSLYKIFHCNKQSEKNVFFLSPVSQKKLSPSKERGGKKMGAFSQNFPLGRAL